MGLKRTQEQKSHVNPRRPPLRWVSPEGVQLNFEIEIRIPSNLKSYSRAGYLGQPGPA